MVETHSRIIVLETQLRAALHSSDNTEFLAYLQTLSNADFRLAGNVLGERILMGLDGDDFWVMFSRLALCHPKAFLGTCLKAAGRKYEAGELSLQGAAFEQYASIVNEQHKDIDRRKTIQHLLPLLRVPQEIDRLFELFHVDSHKVRISYLLQCDRLSACYSLFLSARRLEHEKPWLARCCAELIRKNNRYAFNLASLLKSYFDLPSVSGVFSLNLHPFQLNYVDISYDNFCKILNSI